MDSVQRYDLIRRQVKPTSYGGFVLFVDYAALEARNRVLEEVTRMAECYLNEHEGVCDRSLPEMHQSVRAKIFDNELRAILAMAKEQQKGGDDGL